MLDVLQIQKQNIQKQIEHLGSPPSNDLNHTEYISSLPSKDILLNHIASTEVEDAFFVADLGSVYKQLTQWKRLLPRVEPFYAIKCNPDKEILQLLADSGIGFDCASKNEIQSILDLGVNPSQIIYANPCKQSSHLKYAATNQVHMMTFDNSDELFKIKKYHPQAQLVLRILTDDSKSICRFGAKFGASLEKTADLIQTAIDLQLNLIGVSFHVGSGCFDASAFEEAVMRARIVFNQAQKFGLKLQILDIGGGFPGAEVTEGATFSVIASVLRNSFNKYFPEPEVRIIAEPGRYFVSAAFSLAVNIISRRVVQPSLTAISENATKSNHTQFMYYINDGVYGSFNCILYDHAVVQPLVLKRSKSTNKSSADNQLFECSVWGPTCDSMDCITSKSLLPELQIGDWLMFDNMGAYTVCAASKFNGFKKSYILYTNTQICQS